MRFQQLKDFQDQLSTIGIGGNDLALYLNGQQVYRHLSGFQNVEKALPINEQTLYRMFSMTKPITCAAALQLYEQGKFLLNDPVSAYLPEFSEMQVWERLPQGDAYPRRAQTRMTIKHLFNMTSGLDYDLNAPALRDLYEQTNGHYTTRQFAEAISKTTLGFDPGTHWRYSLSHDVLGALVEVVSGQTLADYCKEHIFQPLSMNSACFRETEIDFDRLCVRYTLDPASKGLVRCNQHNEYQVSDQCFSGGAGGVMTVDDYAKFACAMTNRGVSQEGYRLLAGRTIDLMRTNTLSPDALEDLWHSGPGRNGYGYGLGVRTMHAPAVAGSPSPVGEFGWGGAWGTYVIMDPANQFTLVFAVQTSCADNAYFQLRLRNMAYAALEYEGLL